MEISNQQIEVMVSEFVSKSKDLGLKVTPQRTAIYKELAKTDQHPSTEMIYKNIKDYFPNISLTTVYRTLETFEKHGLISVVNQLYNAARYDANLTPHHHIVCVDCKKIEDVFDNSVNYTKIDSKIQDYEVVGYSVLFNGICSECSGK